MTPSTFSGVPGRQQETDTQSDFLSSCRSQIRRLLLIHLKCNKIALHYFKLHVMSIRFNLSSRDFSLLNLTRHHKSLTQHLVCWGFLLHEWQFVQQCDNCRQIFSNMRRLRNHKRPENCARRQAPPSCDKKPPTFF